VGLDRIDSMHMQDARRSAGITLVGERPGRVRGALPIVPRCQFARGTSPLRRERSLWGWLVKDLTRPQSKLWASAQWCYSS
jgi:hypothetical protein